MEWNLQCWHSYYYSLSLFCSFFCSLFPISFPPCLLFFFSFLLFSLAFLFFFFFLFLSLFFFYFLPFPHSPFWASHPSRLFVPSIPLQFSSTDQDCCRKVKPPHPLDAGSQQLWFWPTTLLCIIVIMPQTFHKRIFHICIHPNLPRFFLLFDCTYLLQNSPKYVVYGCSSIESPPASQ